MCYLYGSLVLLWKLHVEMEVSFVTEVTSRCYQDSFNVFELKTRPVTVNIEKLIVKMTRFGSNQLLRSETNCT